MSNVDKEKVMLAEQVFEVRHAASGKFLDVRGDIADYIKDSGVLAFWEIKPNYISFRDTRDDMSKEGAFVGYQNAGYIVQDTPTRNFFVDRGSLFWKKLIDNKKYTLPELQRFGMRTKVFIPSKINFDGINSKTFQYFITDGARKLIGGKEKDFQIVIETLEDQFEMRIAGGPVHSDESGNYFKFKSDHFKSCGLFLDIDCYQNKDLKIADIPKLLSASNGLVWEKIDKIASGLDL